MLNGRLYDAATLNETVTGNRQRQPYFWEQGGERRRAPRGRRSTEPRPLDRRIDAHNSVILCAHRSAL